MDDLIQRVRALMAEIEHRLNKDEDITPKLKEALRLPAVGADVGVETKPQSNLLVQSKTYPTSTADDRSSTPARQIKLDDYVPSGHNLLHDEGFDASDFIGTGDRDPLEHDAMARGRR